MVTLAPIEHPLFKSVFLNSPLRLIKARGLITLVKTIEGPKNTSSSHSTPS